MESITDRFVKVTYLAGERQARTECVARVLDDRPDTLIVDFRPDAGTTWFRKEDIVRQESHPGPISLPKPVQR